MTVASSHSVELDEQRAELKSVLESAHFLRAPKLAQLLSYLCDTLFSGQSAQIKEYSIGVEVFGRGSGFDQNTDSIVRVEANRLRKRLAEYYAAEGASHRLRITVPVGQYVPEFEHLLVSETALAPEKGLAGGPGSAARGETALRVEPPPAHSQPEVPALAPGQRSFRTPGPRLYILILSALFLLSVLTLVLLYIRATQRHSQLPSTATPANPAALSPAESPFGPPPGDEVRILAGANRSFVDHAGKLWSADTLVTGGAAVKGPAQHIWRTLDPDFYRNSRQGEFRYDIPLRKGIYELRLHFAETTYGPESTGTGGEGSRIMNVRANGITLLRDFDIAADAGASRTADVKVFPNVEPAADGKLHLEFAGQNGGQAELSAIEITSGVRGQLKPVRILARQSPYYSNDSQWWSPDNYFEGGQIAGYPTPVSGTDDPELYQTERWGNFSYAIPVAPGKYSVWVHFAARHAKSIEGGHDVHVFNVFCNGKALLENFDLPEVAKQSDIVVRRFSGLEPNAQGKLLLSFVPVEGYASLTGIEVLPQ
ncbi:MAG TPA: malectin domain-containing carbohydrate-binding protein [Terracidiphilus sp.]